MRAQGTGKQSLTLPPPPTSKQVRLVPYNIQWGGGVGALHHPGGHLSRLQVP